MDGASCDDISVFHVVTDSACNSGKGTDTANSVEHRSTEETRGNSTTTEASYVGHFGTFLVLSDDGDESYTVQLENGRIVHWHLAIDNERIGSNGFAPV